MPVLGLAFTGLTSGTVKWLSDLSRVVTAVVLLLMVVVVGYFGRGAGADREGNHIRPSRLPRSGYWCGA
jgi:hypothetical protein